MPRDHYEVLGLSRGATTEEIAKAYKKLARQHHPDRNPGDKQAEVRFKEIQNAYDTLSDATKRAQYDQFGHEAPPMGGGGPGGFNFNFGGSGGPQIDPDQAQQIFSRVFGEGGGGGINFEDLLGGAAGGGKSGRGKGRSRRAAPQNVEVEANIPFLTAAQGGTVTLRTDSGQIDVKVPAGIEDGKKLRVAGHGPGGGDINVVVKIEPHAWFRREGKDVLLDVPISVSEAILGGKVEVPTLDGRRVDVKIPPGTSTGAKSRLRGLGIAGGDQYLVFKIVVPKGPPHEKSKHLIEEYAKLHPQDARAEVGWK